jgi:hypothetical protein
MTLTNRDIDLIAERVDAWAQTGDPLALRVDDVLALLADVRQLGRQHRQAVALLTRCREQLAAVTEREADLAARLAALGAHDAAETEQWALDVTEAGIEPP